MARLCCFAFMVAVLFSTSDGHKLSYGECPNVPPMTGFDMRKMTGLWYVIEETGSSSSCLTYNFTRSDIPGIYKVEEVYQTSLFGKGNTVGSLHQHDYRYPGSLKAEYPMNIGGLVNYIFFATNYDHFAGIFTCQKIVLAHRYAVSILSRTPHLPESTIDRLHEMMLRRHVDPVHLNKISQDDCGEKTITQ